MAGVRCSPLRLVTAATNPVYSERFADQPLRRSAMTAVLSVDESRALAQSVRSTCERFAPEQRVRDVAYAHIGGRRGFDAELWQVLCTQIGVAAIALPEEAGGAGYGASALGV